MIVAVTGGTGFVGSYVIAQLLRREHAVRALVRDHSRAGRLADRGNVELVEGDLENTEALRRLVAGADAVVHLVGIIEELGRQTFERVHVDGTRRMLDASAGAGARRFVHMSALGARGEKSATAYHRTKFAAEELVRSSGLSTVVLRPSLIAAPENEVMKTLLRMLRLSPVVPVIGNGLYRLQPIAADDVAEAFAVAVENDGITGTFDIAGPDTLTYHDLLDALEQALGVRRRRIAVPVGMVRFSAYAGTVLPNLNPISPDQLQMLLEGNTTTANALETVFQVPPCPFADVAREIAAPWAAMPPGEPDRGTSADRGSAAAQT